MVSPRDCAPRPRHRRQHGDVRHRLRSGCCARCPYPDADRLVRVGESFGGRAGIFLSNRSMPLLEEAEAFEDLAVYRESSVEWAGPEGVVTLSGAAVSPGMLPLLRATPRLGRLFTEDEAREGADRVVLLSHRAWTNRFSSDPDIVGAPLELDGDPHTVVGVLPEGFYFPNPRRRALDAARRPAVRAAGGGRRGAAAHGDADRLQRPRPPRAGGFGGAGGDGGPHPAWRPVSTSSGLPAGAARAAAAALGPERGAGSCRCWRRWWARTGRR